MLVKKDLYLISIKFVLFVCILLTFSLSGCSNYPGKAGLPGNTPLSSIPTTIDPIDISPPQVDTATIIPLATPGPSTKDNPTENPAPGPTSNPANSPAPASSPSPINVQKNPSYKLEVDVTNQVVTAFERDARGHYTVVVRQMICSTGEPETPTILGTFKIPGGKYDRARWAFFPTGVYAQYFTRIYKGYLFHSVIYSKPDVNYMMVSTYNKLGSTASLGCIRLLVEDAKWIYDNCGEGTEVTIIEKDKNPELTARLKPKELPIPKATSTHRPTMSPEPSKTLEPTLAPTPSPATSTPKPSTKPTDTPVSPKPTVTPTAWPTMSPTLEPTASPTASPTISPTPETSDAPDTPEPSEIPITPEPTDIPNIPGPTESSTESQTRPG